MKISVILSTYNAPQLLEKVLAGYARQTAAEFEIVIADDGSTDETRRMLEASGSRSRVPIRHVWHDDQGFRKCAILNRAIEAASGDYLVISDGDCVPWDDFVETHGRLARRGCFVSGGYCKLGFEASRALTADEVQRGRAGDVRWLLGQGPSPWRLRRLLLPRGCGPWLDRLTPTRPTWNGHNASGWKSDLVRVNGFDERMGYGGEDREMGERLVNAGIRGIQARHRAICMHLWHERGYVRQDVLRRNLEIRRATADRRADFTPYGIVKT